MTADQTIGQTAGVDVEAVAREAYRFLHPGGVDTPDLLRSPESDAAERDRAYETWDDGRAGTFDHAECRGLAAALAPVIAAAEQRGREQGRAEQAAVVEAAVAEWEVSLATAPADSDLGQIVGGEVIRSVRAVLPPNTDAALADVRAEALRDAADEMDDTDDPDAIYVLNGDIDLWLRARADRIAAAALTPAEPTEGDQ